MALGGIFFLFILTGCLSADSWAEYPSKVGWVEAAKFMGREEARTGYLPKITDRFPGLGIPDAYEIQNYLIRAGTKKNLVVGYKAGFTGLDDRDRFGLQHPVSGVLFSGCGYKGEVSLSLQDHPGLMLELEIGYRLKSKITEPMKSSEDLDRYVADGFPAIELPQIKFRNLKGISGVDLVAANMASACWIEGSSFTGIDPSHYDSLKVSLFLDGELIDSGFAGAVNGQKAALLWLVQHLQRRNVRLEEGLLLLTGKIGNINPAKVGEYVAVYGEKKLFFQIRH